MPRNDQVTRQWHLLRHLEAAAHGRRSRRWRTPCPPTSRSISGPCAGPGGPGGGRVPAPHRARRGPGGLEAPGRVPPDPRAHLLPTELMALTFSRDSYVRWRGPAPGASTRPWRRPRRPSQPRARLPAATRRLLCHRPRPPRELPGPPEDHRQAHGGHHQEADGPAPLLHGLPDRHHPREVDLRSRYEIT